MWSTREKLGFISHTYCKQEYIPVGCVPPTAVGICWGRECLPQCMLRYTAPWPDPSTSPLGVDLENPPPPGQTPQLPRWCGPGEPLARPLNLPLGCGPGEPPIPPVRPLNFPTGVGLETLLARPLNLPLGVGLETSPHGQTPKPPPWVLVWRPARHAEIPPPTPLWTE